MVDIKRGHEWDFSLIASTQQPRIDLDIEAQRMMDGIRNRSQSQVDSAKEALKSFDQMRRATNPIDRFQAGRVNRKPQAKQ